MPDFDESVFDAMSDEELSEYLAHDAELPLSFIRSAEAVLYAATVLALRQTDTLPDPAAALEIFKNDYLSVPFDGCTLWDDPPRYGGAAPAAGQPKPRAAAPAAAKPEKRPAARRKAPAAKIARREKPALPPIPPIPGTLPEPVQPPQIHIPAPAQPPEKPFMRSAAGLLVAALLILLVGLGYLYIRTTMRSMIDSGPSPSPTAASSAAKYYTLTWVPDGYSETAFTDWDVSGYLYTWKNAAGSEISFSRYPVGSRSAGIAAAAAAGAGSTAVTVCGCSGQYARSGSTLALVFTDAAGGSVYYLDAGSVSDSEAQKLIAAIK